MNFPLLNILVTLWVEKNELFWTLSLSWYNQLYSVFGELQNLMLRMANRAFLEEKNKLFGELARKCSNEAETPYLGFSVFGTFWGFLVIFWVLKNELFPLLKIEIFFLDSKNRQKVILWFWAILRGLELREERTILTLL